MTEREATSNQPRTSLDDAIAAAREGRRDEAAQLLRQVVADDPFNVDAWIWLGGVAPDAHEQRRALEHALTIAPANQRAQQGLNWLRERRPEVFASGNGETAPQAETSVEAAPAPAEGATLPLAATGATMVERHATVYEAPATDVEPSYAAQAATGAQAQTEQMPALAAAAPAVRERQTDRMAVAPPPAAEEVVEQRHTGANVARWLILLLYLPGLGAAATLAGAALYDPDGFVQNTNALLAPLNSQLNPADLQTTYWSVVAVLIGVAVVDLMIALGFGFRQRWAWTLNLILATLMLAGSIALLVPELTLPSSLVGPFVLTNPVFQALGGVAIFSLVFFLLSVASYRAFFPRRVVQQYER